jgi:hypothetical protein
MPREKSGRCWIPTVVGRETRQHRAKGFNFDLKKKKKVLRAALSSPAAAAARQTTSSTRSRCVFFPNTHLDLISVGGRLLRPKSLRTPHFSGSDAAKPPESTFCTPK